MSYYELLEITDTATEEEIKTAYRKMAMRYHPDRNPGDKEAEECFKKITDAYDALMDPITHSHYDGSQKVQKKEGKAKNTDRDEESVRSAGRRYTPYTQKELDMIQCSFFGGNEEFGRNILVTLLLSLQELHQGCVKTIKFKKRSLCEICQGYGDGKTYTCQRCDGTGNVAKEKLFPDIYPECPLCDGLGYLESGCKFCESGLTHNYIIEECSIEVPARCPSGYQVVLRGRGEPGKKGVFSGNLHVIIATTQPEPVRLK